ncbi:MAG: hypothetical protein C0602_00325 [Denitrovibrio sp.]|nr:MAG: hypothetical protein C0602_00325 [Denitrovibrio sp.]
MTTYKCPDCGAVYCWNGKGERPGKCTQKRGWKAGHFKSCGHTLIRQHEIEDVKTVKVRK